MSCDSLGSAKKGGAVVLRSALRGLERRRRRHRSERWSSVAWWENCPSRCGRLEDLCSMRSEGVDVVNDTLRRTTTDNLRVSALAATGSMELSAVRLSCRADYNCKRPFAELHV